MVTSKKVTLSRPLFNYLEAETVSQLVDRDPILDHEITNIYNVAQ